MRADPEEYMGVDRSRSRFPYVELMLAAALIAGLVIFWFWTQEKPPVETTVAVPPVPTTETQAVATPTPDIPQRSEPVTVVVPENAPAVPGESVLPEPTEPPITAPLTAQQGDELLRQQLAAAGAKPLLLKLLKNEQPLEVSAALIDGLGNGVILRKFLPAGLHSERFGVLTQDDGVYMNPTSFLRYDRYADAIAALDVGVLVNAFHLLRPLYEQSYGYLGLNPDDFDNAVIRTLDLVLATPEIGEPIALKPKAVMYLYADPALESLPEVQKQLLRMGPDNIRRIKQQAQALRDGLLAR